MEKDRFEQTIKEFYIQNGWTPKPFIGIKEAINLSGIVVEPEAFLEMLKNIMPVHINGLPNPENVPIVPIIFRQLNPIKVEGGLAGFFLVFHGLAIHCKVPEAPLPPPTISPPENGILPGIAEPELQNALRDTAVLRERLKLKCNDCDLPALWLCFDVPGLDEYFVPYCEEHFQELCHLQGEDNLDFEYIANLSLAIVIQKANDHIKVQAERYQNLIKETREKKPAEKPKPAEKKPEKSST